MSRANVPAAVLAARGVPITLLDETQPRLLYTFSSIMRLEEQHGSLAAAMNVVVDGEKGAAFSGMLGIIAAGLEHEATADGARLSDVETLRYLLDPKLMEDYGNAIKDAFELSFPFDPDSGAEADPTQGAESSPGTTGTTSAPSLSDAQLTSSGA
jgi:hypothetical protein